MRNGKHRDIFLRCAHCGEALQPGGERHVCPKPEQQAEQRRVDEQLRAAQRAVDAAVESAKTESQKLVEISLLEAFAMPSSYAIASATPTFLRFAMAGDAMAELVATIREHLFNNPMNRMRLQNYAAECDARALGKTFVVIESPETAGGKAITCLRCNLTSHHPEDVAHLWCAKCNAEHTP